MVRICFGKKVRREKKCDWEDLQQHKKNGTAISQKKQPRTDHHFLHKNVLLLGSSRCVK